MSGEAEDTAPWQIVESRFEAAGTGITQLPGPVGVEVAFAGRSNVGKSTLMNALMRRKRLVRTSSTPGCTRQINIFFSRARDGAEFRLVDLPGYGYAKRSKTERRQWGQLIEGYLEARAGLRAVVILVDIRRGAEQEERDLAEFLQTRHPNDRPQVVWVATKVDRVKKSQQQAMINRLKSAGNLVFPVAAPTGEGVEALWRGLRRATNTPLISRKG